MRIKEGDIFILPLDKKCLINNEGEYIPQPQDKVGLGQYIYQGPRGQYIAIFKACLTYEELTEEYIKNIYLQPVLFLHESHTYLASKKRWLKIGNFKIQEKMPMQAYSVEYVTNGQTLYKAEDYIYTNPESEHIGHRKKINHILAKKLHKYGRSCTPIILEEVTQKYFKIINYPHYNIKDYMPKKSGLVWKVFPEFYNNSWRENNTIQDDKSSHKA